MICREHHQHSLGTLRKSRAWVMLCFGGPQKKEHPIKTTVVRIPLTTEMQSLAPQLMANWWLQSDFPLSILERCFQLTNCMILIGMGLIKPSCQPFNGLV